MDKQIIMSIQAHSNKILDAFFSTVVYLSSTKALILYIIIAYFLVKNKKYIYRLIVVVATSAAVNIILKNIIKRPRPYVQYLDVIGRYTKSGGGYSFPSGHSQMVSTLAFFIIFNTKSKLIKFISLLVIVIVAFSRMYFGLHFITDVIAGAVIGFVINYIFYLLWKKK